MPWWGTALCCIGFGIWTLFCLLSGAAIAKASAQQQRIMDKFNFENPVKNPWPDREN